MHTTFLDVTIDHILTVHVENVTAKISKGVGVLIRLNKEISDNILTLKYHIFNNNLRAVGEAA